MQIQSLECTSCMECVAVCPAENALQFALPPRDLVDDGSTQATVTRWRNRIVEPRMVAAVLAILFVGFIVAARVTGHWQTDIPRDVYMKMVPHADEYGH
jgi:ferredoxin